MLMLCDKQRPVYDASRFEWANYFDDRRSLKTQQFYAANSPRISRPRETKQYSSRSNYNRLIESRFSISISTTPKRYAVRCLCLVFIRGKIIITRCDRMWPQCSHRIHRVYHCRRIFLIRLQKNRRKYKLRCRFPRDKLQLDGTRRKSNILQQKNRQQPSFAIYCCAWETRRAIFFREFYPCGWRTSAK